MEIQLSKNAAVKPDALKVSLSKPQRAADTVVALQSMQKKIGAEDFAVLRVRGQGAPSARRLGCTLSSWADRAEHNAAALLEAYGDGLMAHLETSMLPVVWEGAAVCEVAATEQVPFIERFPSQRLPCRGIAFPVRLGASGSGFVVFTGDVLAIDSDVIVDLHMRANRIMVDLLAADERKMQPAEALNEREIACLQMAGDGCISEAIAEKMGLSVHTVNAYLGTATTKLDAVNRIQAIAKAIRLGYIR